MKRLFAVGIFSLLFLSNPVLSHADCNQLLSGSASIHDLAKLRFDLDQKRAAGIDDAVTRALEDEYQKKIAEIVRTTPELEPTLQAEISAEIGKIQGETVTRETEVVRQREDEAREIEENRREMSFFDGLKESRVWHLQSELPDGSLLVTGGKDASGVPLSSIERVDLKKKTSVMIGSFLDLRTDYAHTVLPDGRLLVSGGLFRDTRPLTSVEIIDPVRKTVEKFGDLKNHRFNHHQVLLPDGRVLILPGTGDYLTRVEIIDVKQGTIKPFGGLKFPVKDTTTALLSDGRVMIVGKHERSKSLFVEVFDPATHSSQYLGKIAGIHPRATISIQPDGTILACGGVEGSNAFSGVFAWNPFQKTLKKIGDLSEPKYDMIPSRLPDGRVFLSGGADSMAHTVTRLEVVDLTQGTVDPVGDLPEPMWLYSQTALSNGTVVITGGYGNYGQKRSVILIRVGRR